jgi:hypothetical protein
MTKDESEQIAKMCGALLIYNPHGAPTTAQDLPIHQYAEFVEQVVRMTILNAITLLTIQQGGEPPSIEDISKIIKGD